MRRADLEAGLASVPPHADPDPALEQYATPAHIATEFLWHAYLAGDVAGRRVLDLGCGTGVLSIGAALLGAARVVAVDVSQAALKVAEGAAATLGVAPLLRFIQADVAEGLQEQDVAADTVVMNPPFGAQRRHADRPFYAAAVAAAPHGAVWFLAQTRTQGFLDTMARAVGRTLTRVDGWRFPLPATMPHHSREAALIDVGAYRLSPN